ncbi:MAG: hypothetical protein KF902_13495 [Phycisphaeraceae bacterium]|nr:hypothetical protein [Phycisphaeraceae bacterium]MCW5769244.1 hypothetical protein [Phycisphaeraceae bacterium]
MPTWTLLSPARVNREGNQIEFQFEVTGLAMGFEPTLLRSRINAVNSLAVRTFGSLAGWRADGSNPRQYFEDPLFPPPEPQLFSGAVVSLEQVETTVVVNASLRLRPTALISIGADLRPSTRAIFSTSLQTELVRLKQFVNDAGVPSPTFAFDVAANTPFAMNLTDSSANVGKLPGWDGEAGAPTLRLHCDSFAERSRRKVGGTIVNNEPLDGWADLRSTTPNNLTQSNAGRQPRIFANTGTPPEIRFTNDLLEQTAGYDLEQSACAFGVVFRATPGATALTEHLIGRWSGSSGTDNSSKWQWCLLYERSGGSPQVHKIKAQFVYNNSGMFFSVATVEATIDAPTAKTIALYRVTDTSPTTGELWVNGVRVATTTTFLPGTNGLATDLLTVGARYNGAGAVTDALAGSIDQCFVYSSAISDATLSAVHHELARRAGIKLGPVLASNLTQPYGDSNPEPRRRMDRWPIAMINLFGGGNYDGNPLSQIEAWRNGGDRQQIVAWFRERILRILNACPDYDIMINRPQGNYANDIIAAGIFGEMDVSPNEPIIQDYQWEALTGWTDGSGTHPGVFGEFGLSDHNHRDNKAAPDSEGFARRCWFYTGNPTIDDDGAVTQNARVGARNLAPCSATFYIGSFFDPWVVKDDRFRCFFVDSASKWDRKWVEIVQDAITNEHFTLVGEAIALDPNARGRWHRPPATPGGKLTLHRATEVGRSRPSSVSERRTSLPAILVLSYGGGV